MAWVHDISLSALAAAVVTLGVVMLLELRAMARLRRSMDVNLGRIFEQLDLLRFENQQLLQGQGMRVVRSPAAAAAAVPATTAPATTATSPSVPVAVISAPREPVREAGEREINLGAGEAKLLASLAAARARRAEAVKNENVEAEAPAAKTARPTISRMA